MEQYTATLTFIASSVVGNKQISNRIVDALPRWKRTLHLTNGLGASFYSEEYYERDGD